VKLYICAGNIYVHPSINNLIVESDIEINSIAVLPPSDLSAFKKFCTQTGAR